METKVRKRPTHLPNVTRSSMPVIVFVTVCAADRSVNTFANEAMHQTLCEAWKMAESYLVGSYVLMSDHVHLFCAPTSMEVENVSKWVRYWKSLVTRAIRGRPAGGASVCLPGDKRNVDEQMKMDEQTLVPPGLRTDLRCGAQMDEQTLVPPGAGHSVSLCTGEGRASARPLASVPSVFQRDCWDTQLRRGESYHDKWEYVRNNPVRRGLVECADAWPYWGVLNDLVW